MTGLLHAIPVATLLLAAVCQTALCQVDVAPARSESSPSAPVIAQQGETWASVELKRGDFRVVVAAPDAERSFYSGPRFDHSGFVYSADLRGLRLFGPWTVGFKRGNTDSVVGTAGEFGMNAPLGFDEAKAGDLFLKVGVGHLRRKDDSPYHFSKKYEIVNRGKWEVSSGEAFFEAVHVIEPLRDWGYEYKKRIELVDPASIAITYRLKNTGQRTISTDYYSHNFFVFNSEMIGEGDGVEILADNAAPKLRPPAQVHPRKVEFTGDIIPGKGYFLEVPLPDSLENRPLARIYQKRSGASVVISSTCSPYKLAIYGHSRALCAEPFVRIQLEPGKEMEWTDTYQLIVRR